MGDIGGVLSGVNPFHYNAGSPLTLFLFQACLILATCNLVHIPFSKLRQPKVISEVIAGVILGPTVFGQIPNYTETVFPASSIPGLSLTANLGIILFMFFLGLEVDIAFIRKHIKTALSIGLITLAVPFGFGCLFSIPLYHNYANKDENARHIKFTVFMVFIAVSLSVTAFPVLCRILNELRLIKDRAGIVVLAAGIINDILGWVLLALSVILSSSESSPVNTVYILLCTLGWFLIYFYPLKFILKWALIRTHELDRSKPSPMATMCILFIMFISAYFTDIIGVHPIFGAFIAGLIVPRENHYVVKLTERMEDIPNIVLIPIYFAVAGLNVDLTLLNEGKDWGYVFASIGIAIASKVFSGSLTAKVAGLFWGESLAVGILMSCKGIVEIVVLSVGLNAGIISKKIFGMFILMALVSTFVTTPLTQLVYTESYRESIREYLHDSDNESEHTSLEQTNKFTAEDVTLNDFKDLKNFQISEIINIINTTESISPSLELLNHLVYGMQPYRSIGLNDTNKSLSRTSTLSTLKSNSFRLKKLAKWRHSPDVEDEQETQLEAIDENPTGFDYIIPLKAVRLRLLTERTTDLLQSSTLYNDDPHFAPNSDSILQIFDIFSRLGKTPFTSEVIFSTMREKATNILSLNSDPTNMVLIPLKGASYEYKGSPVLIDEKYVSFDHIFSHLLGLNELSSNFFHAMTDIKSNIAFLISNTGGRLNVDRFKKKAFNLLLPNPNLTASDFLAIYILLFICYRDQKSGDDVIATIFINEKNGEFVDNLYETFSHDSWINKSIVNIIPINTKKKSEETSHNSFIGAILEAGLTEEAHDNLEETTFIIPETYFGKEAPFSDEVKETILQGSNERFNLLIVHHYSPEADMSKHMQ